MIQIDVRELKCSSFLKSLFGQFFLGILSLSAYHHVIFSAHMLFTQTLTHINTRGPAQAELSELP